MVKNTKSHEERTIKIVEDEVEPMKEEASGQRNNRHLLGDRRSKR